MFSLILTEFQKLKRYSIILIGMMGVACSPVISIVMQNIMTDDAKGVLNYAFPDLLNSTIWNNMTIFFPMILALIGGYMINREYTDDTLKNILTVPLYTYGSPVFFKTDDRKINRIRNIIRFFRFV